MGGLGALNSHFKNPGKFVSVSAFAPIAFPSQSPWGIKAFNEFFGSVQAGEQWDPTHLVAHYNGPKTPLLVDQGTSDKWLKEHLKTGDFINAAYKSGYKVDFREREGYSHDFFYLSTFLEEHIEFHARYLHTHQKL